MGSVDIRLVREDDIIIYGSGGLKKEVKHDGKEYLCPYDYCFLTGGDVNCCDYGNFKRVLYRKVYSWFPGFHGKETFFGKKLLCNYCDGGSHGEIEIAIRRIFEYRKPPPGAKNLNILSKAPFYAFRVNRTSAYCKKCGRVKETLLPKIPPEDCWGWGWVHTLISD